MKNGWKLDIREDCEAQEAIGASACLQYEAKKENFELNLWINSTYTLNDNEYCTITVDATKYPAKFIISDSPRLGMLIPGY